jgi:hypothetical protein
MRLLLRYRTGDITHPNGDVDGTQVRTILSTLGWLPRDNEFAQEKLREVIARLPDGIQREIRHGDPVLIEPRTGLWGIVSAENHNQLRIRLIEDDLDTLKDVATTVVDEFPIAFHSQCSRDLGFDPEVAIRRFDSEIRIVVGRIEEYHTAGFWRFCRKLRRRESFLTILLVALTVAAVAGAAVMYKLTPHGDWEFWRGYLDRGGTAVLVAALTTVINLYFEFRNWRNDKRRINWGSSVDGDGSQ